MQITLYGNIHGPRQAQSFRSARGMVPVRAFGRIRREIPAGVIALRGFTAKEASTFSAIGPCFLSPAVL